jgi:hypothetical protein
MRAVKTVIAAAGNLKREQEDFDEDQICLSALRNVNVPKFLKDDLKLFNGKFLLIPRREETRSLNNEISNKIIEKNSFIIRLYNSS